MEGFPSRAKKKKVSSMIGSANAAGLAQPAVQAKKKDHGAWRHQHSLQRHLSQLGITLNPECETGGVKNRRLLRGPIEEGGPTQL